MTTNPEPMDRRQLLRDALLRIDEMQTKLDAAEKARTEPIAIIGMGCRFPGGVDSPDSYWQLLRDGVDAVHEIPKSRMDSTVYGDADFPSVWYAGLLDKIDGFDASFFGISPREATSLDPQQRLTLEVGWEALENAGIAPDSVGGSQTGVFMGVSTNDYAQLLRMQGAEYLDVYSATGGALNAVPGRLAYTLGLNGPSVAVDTACSSSLVAIHLASQSLQSGESDLALAGGVNTVLMPEAFICFSRWGMMASDGRCKTFDASADGFVRSEGCGMVVLKRLSDAVADGDTILAIIRGSAVNQDGRSSGLTVPNGPAQQAVIRRALNVAKVKPAEISYIETHGTGTLIGDPIEVEAIGAVLGEGRPKDLPLVIGAVKTNIGHAESASGIAGLIKVVLSMQHQEIPRNLHFHEPNARIPWPDFPTIVPKEQLDWTPINGRRLAGISGFGFSGTNAHVVLEEAPTLNPDPSPSERGESSERAAQILTLSGVSEAAVRELAGKYHEYFRAHPDVSLVDASYTAITGRAQFPYRMAVVGGNVGDVEIALSAAAAGEAAIGLVQGKADKKIRQKIAFMFTGQGSQYVGMGRGLYETQPVFRAALDQCDQLLLPYLKQPLLSVLYPAEGEASPLDETTYTQPALFALEYALAQVWMSWGIQPSAVMGHSVGEYVAAVIAGVFSLEDGLKLIAERGRLMGALPAGGEMAAVFADEATVKAAIAPYAKQVSLAAVNGPENIVISGAGEAVETILESLKAAGVKARKLNVSHAFHSPLMEPMLNAFAKVAGQVKYSQPRVKLISNVTGEVAGAEIAQADYWRKHVREAVQFAKAIETLHNDGFNTFLEVGPSPTLIGMGQRVVEDENLSWVTSLRSGRDDWGQMLGGLAALYVRGVSIGWAAANGDAPHHKIALPTYPFQREHYWIENIRGTATASPSRHSGEKMHPLLGYRVPLAHSPNMAVWENEISLHSLPYLRDHQVENTVIVPATAYMEIGLAAVVESGGKLPLAITKVENKKPLFMRDEMSYTLQVVLNRESNDQWSFAVYSHPATMSDTWTLHVNGEIHPVAEQTVSTFIDPFDTEAIQARCEQRFTGQDFYQQLAQKGNQWGTAFQGIDQHWRGQQEALSFVRVPDMLVAQIGAYQLHPAVADAAGHVLTATISMEKSDENRGGAFVGGGVDETLVYARPSGKGLWCYARLRPTEAGQDENILIGDVAVFDEDGRLISETLGAKLWYLDHNNATDSVENWFYDLQWEPAKDTPAFNDSLENWLILGDSQGIGNQLAALIKANSGQATVVRTDANTAIESFLQTATRIVHLGSLDAVHSDQLMIPNLENSVGIGIASALQVVHSLAQLRAQNRARLWLVTRGGQPVNGGANAVEVAQSPLWGFGRSLAVEHAEFWGGLIDLDPDISAENAAQSLWEALHASEDQQAIRQGQRYVARLAHVRINASSDEGAFRCRPDGAYLITGGLGGLGLEVAQRLVQDGARRLILMGRTALPSRMEWSQVDPAGRSARAIHAIRDLEAMGVSVHVASVDVGDEAQLRAFFDQYRAEGWPPIRGVVHAAGLMQYQALAEHQTEDMLQILRPKVFGGWLLHTLLEDAPLDFFVLFSSVSVLLSSPLIASYAAANGFLDALAHYRRARGLPALSINWGAWGETGMIADFGAGDRTDALMQPMSNRDALQALEWAMQQDAPQMAVMATNSARWSRLYNALQRPPFLSRIMESHLDEAEPTATGGISYQVIAEADPSERLPLLESFLIERVSRALGYGQRAFDTSESLLSLGMDSLMAVELKNGIEKNLGIAIPVAHLLQGPSTTQLATMLLDQFDTQKTEASEETAEIWEEGEL